MYEDHLRSKLRHIVAQEKHHGDSDRLLKALLDVKALSLGIEIQCPVCSQRSWFSMTDVDYEVSCPACFAVIPIPCHLPREMKWSYRAIGPFSLPRKAYGAYSVLLTLRFFNRVLDGATTPLLSFTAIKGNANLEVDLGMLFMRSRFGNHRTRLVFAECKSHQLFSRRDLVRMRNLGKEFPEAILVFGTLKADLSSGEKNRIASLVRRSRMRRRLNKPFNIVLILTANEMFAGFGISERWSNLSEKHKALKDLATRGIDELAEATQQLYLGTEPWHEWLRQHPPKHRAKPKIQLAKRNDTARSDSAQPPKVYLDISTRLQEIRDFEMLEHGQ